MIWHFFEHKKPQEDKDIIIISHNGDKELSNGVIRWWGRYQNGKYIVTSFDSPGTCELTLPVVCWTEFPISPFDLDINSGVGGE